jgi:hypothetical protein
MQNAQREMPMETDMQMLKALNRTYQTRMTQFTTSVARNLSQTIITRGNTT